MENGCHEYGSFIWPRFLKETYDLGGLAGEGLVLLEEIWDGIKWNGGTGIDRTDDELQERGSSIDEAFAEFGRWNFYTWYRDDGQHYEEGGDYTNLVAYDRIYTSYPWYDQHPSSTKRPDRLGTSYMRFNRDANSDHNALKVVFDGPSTTNAVSLLAKESGADIFHEYEMTLDGNQNGELIVEGWDNMEYAYMAVSIRNLSADSQDYAFDVETFQGSASVGDAPRRTVVMSQNRPNPFYPATTIHYSLSEPAQVSVRILDAAGRVVRTLVNEHQSGGVHEVKWLAVDGSGRPVPAGIYFYQVQAGSQSHSRKMLLMP
jgi:hypothetical protein